MRNCSYSGMKNVSPHNLKPLVHRRLGCSASRYVRTKRLVEPRHSSENLGMYENVAARCLCSNLSKGFQSFWYSGERISHKSDATHSPRYSTPKVCADVSVAHSTLAIKDKTKGLRPWLESSLKWVMTGWRQRAKCAIWYRRTGTEDDCENLPYRKSTCTQWPCKGQKTQRTESKTAAKKKLNEQLEL